MQVGSQSLCSGGINVVEQSVDSIWHCTETFGWLFNARISFLRSVNVSSKLRKREGQGRSQTYRVCCERFRALATIE